MARRVHSTESTEGGRSGQGLSIVDRLGRRSALIFVLLALVAVAAYFLMEGQTADDRASAAEINLAGRRRMLSQRIGLLASQLQQKHDAQQAGQLGEAVDQMDAIHAALLRGGNGFRQALGGPADNPLAPPAVNAAVARFLQLGRNLAGLTPDSPTYRPTADELVALSLGSLLPELDHLVDLYQAESERRTDALRLLQAGALLAALGLLAFSALGVLRPLIGQVRGTLDDLEKSDQALRQAMSENQLILETTDDGIFGVDRDGRLRFANQAAARMLGRAASELVGRPHHPDIVTNAADCPICRTLADGKAAQVANGWFSRHGDRRNGDDPAFPVEFSVSPRPDGEGAIISFRDITERYQTEMKLQRFQQRLVDAIEAMDDAFALFDADDRLALYNLRFTELFPLQGDSIRLGMSFADFVREIASQGLYDVPPEQQAAWLDERIAAHRRANGSTEVAYADGAWLRANERRTREGGTVVIWTDVTHLKQALIAADQGSQAKSEFLARMSHELRTPLNAILGFAQVLDSGTPPLTPGQREYVGHILHGGRHLLGLISEVLDMSSIEAGKLVIETEHFALAPLLGECLSLLAPLAANRDLRLHGGAGDGVMVSADRKRLKQVLLNLLSNAIKYNRHGGEVRLAVDASPTGLRLSIADNGPGIAPALAQRVFQPFDRLGADKAEGTGIGLAITRRLVELMGGHIGFDSTPGVGTTFWIELPGSLGQIIAAASQTPLPSAPPADTPAQPSLLAFGLDTADRQLLQLVASTVRQLRLVDAANPAEAETLLAAGDCRAIVVDAGRLNELPAAWPVGRPLLIALGSAAGNGVTAGVDHWQPKPLNSRTMARLLREIMQ